MFTFTLIDVAAGLIALTIIGHSAYTREWHGVVLGALALTVVVSLYLSTRGLIPDLVSAAATVVLVMYGIMMMIKNRRTRVGDRE